MTTLQELLKTKVDIGHKDKPKKVIPPFRVAVQDVRPDGVHFIIHPNGYDGETLDFLVQDNTLIPIINGIEEVEEVEELEENFDDDELDDYSDR
jgi:hypothetical protein